MYDLVVRGGLLVDPSQRISEKMDITIRGGKVIDVQNKVSEGNSRRVVDASGMIVTPGLVDIHTHVAYDVVRLSVNPETSCLMRGTTTAVDAGSVGELNFAPFKRYVIERSRTRILSFINIESLGMIEYANVVPNQTDQEWPQLLWAANEKFSPLFVNVRNTKDLIRRDRKDIVGIKWAHHGLKVLRLAREVANSTGCRIMSENHYMPYALKFLRKGDIVTHAYHYAKHKITQKRDGLTEDCKKIHQEFFDAVKKGVLLDVGHGQGSFSWKVASLALEEGLEPHTISTDLWVGSVDGPVYDMPMTMSKFLHLGMSLEKVVEASTSRPACALGLSRIGTLKPGSHADLAIFKLRTGQFPLADSYGQIEKGDKILVPVQVIKEGELILAER